MTSVKSGVARLFLSAGVSALIAQIAESPQELRVITGFMLGGDSAITKTEAPFT